MRTRVVAVLVAFALGVGVVAVVAVPLRGASEVRITAAGDFGARSATDAVLRKVAELGPDVHVALGDLAYGDASPESAWCAYVKQRVGEGFPFQLVAGNHESHDIRQGLINNYSACLPNQVPGVVGTYGREYYMDVPQPSPVARVISASPALSFEDGRWDYAAGDAHYAWVADAIDDARADGLQWVVVAAHIPCLGVGVHGCPAPRDFYDLLLAKRVDLVLHGHEHAYLRSHQLVSGVPGCPVLDISGFDADCVVDTDDAFAAGAGTVFATVGTGGIPLRDLNLSDPVGGYFASLSGKNANATYGVLDLTITAERLQAGFVAASGGDHSDAFVIDTSEEPPNQPPTARFTVADDGLSVAVDAAGSTDDGSIASYAWDFGDGSGGAGVAASHTYAAGGTYAITLTVTDELGAQGTSVRQVTVSDGSGEIQTVELAPTDDSYVRSDQAGGNYGSGNQFHSLSSSPALIPYLGFALPEAPAGSTLVGASLRLRTTTTSSSGSPATHSVELAAEAFDEATLTYQNRPADAGVTLGQVVPAEADTAYEIALDPVAVAGKLGGPMAVSVPATGNRDLAHIWSKEFVVDSYRPQLTLEFETL